MVVGKEHAEYIDEPVEAVKEAKTSKKESKKKGKNSSSGASGGVEFMSIEDLKLLRESGLDRQYSESTEEAMYACIPADEMLPTDRVARCVPQSLMAPLN